MEGGLEYKLSWGGGGEKERESRLSGGSGESGERVRLQPEHVMRTELESYVLSVPVEVRKSVLCQV